MWKNLTESFTFNGAPCSNNWDTASTQPRLTALIIAPPRPWEASDSYRKTNHSVLLFYKYVMFHNQLHYNIQLQNHIFLYTNDNKNFL